MMRRVLLLAAVALLLVAGASFAAAGTIVGSKHDLTRVDGPVSGGTTEICVFCHTPHQAAAANAQYPLWNHNLSATTSYTLYTSSTLNATITAWGGGTAGTATVSQLCMSCHDGTVAVGTMWNPPNNGTTITYNTGGGVSATGLINTVANVGTDLSNDHPVNFTYNATLASDDGELATPASTAWVDAGQTVPLFSGTVQCASCHDAHGTPGFYAFLVKDNSLDSALCTTCHVK